MWPLIGRLGTSGGTYEVAVFCENDTQAAAQGQLIHDDVDRKPTVQSIYPRNCARIRPAF